ncbi:MAG: M28 family peptidase [Chloroflexi bacterium]|nr:M28 family peptidase [Chloroflexota bacterium]
MEQPAPVIGSTPTLAATVVPPSATPLVFSGARAYSSVEQQVALGPRITGSWPNRNLGNQILNQLAANGWVTQTQVFSYMNTPVRNLVGVKGTGKDIIILGAHYDTRRRADRDQQHPDQPVPGADDGGSGVAVLLELSRVLRLNGTGKQVWLVFFDAEDNGDLDGWPWLVGSRYFANSLSITPTAVVVVDMVGDMQQDIYLERNSNQALAGRIWDVAQGLGYSSQFIRQLKWSMLDDHTPFLEKGLPAVDVIDFDYPYWHTVQDTPDKISPDSLARVGRTLQVWLESQ